MYKVAIITPCFNRGQFVSDCILSVSSANTFGFFEIEHIIIDDASTDDSLETVEKLKVPNLKILKLKENKGPAFARNFGIDQSDADYIFCLDSDDVLFQNSLFSLLTFALEKKADWVYGDFIRGDSELRYQIGQDFFGWKFNKIDDVLTSMYKKEHFFQQNCLFSQKSFEKSGEYDEGLHIAEDFDLFTRMLLTGYFPFYLPGPIYIHRFHKDNLSKIYTKDPENHEQTVRELYRRYSDRLKRILSKDSITSIEETQSTWSRAVSG